MIKYLFLISILFIGCSAKSYDCTKANKDKMLEYMKWCYSQIGVSMERCQEQTKEIYCIEYEPKAKRDTIEYVPVF